MDLLEKFKQLDETGRYWPGDRSSGEFPEELLARGVRFSEALKAALPDQEIRGGVVEPQDQYFFGTFLFANFHLGNGQYPAIILSNFGNLAAIDCEEHLPEDIVRRIKEKMIEFGYEYVPFDIASESCVPDGELTWYGRFFSVE